MKLKNINVDWIKAWLRFIKRSTRKEWAERNQYILSDKYRPVHNQRVNLYWTGTFKGEITEHENLGDYLSTVIVNWMLEKRDISIEAFVGQTKHLYAIGSILGFGFQDATVWGSGLLKKENAYRLVRQKLDIRSVRGPVTRNMLLPIGIQCPECYGDPAILMPLIYDKEVEKKYKVSVILHHTSAMRQDIHTLVDGGVNYIEILTKDYEYFIDEVRKSEVIISSALHGIIIAESYGVPSVYLKEAALNQDLKFIDWYSSTGRTEYKYATSFEEALKELPTNSIPDLTHLRQDVLSAFPYDLWIDNE